METDTPVLLYTGIGLLLCLGLYQWIVQPAFLSPLSSIPNVHWTAPISPLWILNERRLRRETLTVHEAHQRLGPVVRLAPREISVNSVDGGIRTVYAGGYEKGDWYRNVFNNYGIMPMFSMPHRGPHSKRKRMVSNVYAKSTLQSSPAVATIAKVLLEDRLIPRLGQRAIDGGPIEFYMVMSAVTTDFVSSYVFGLENGSNFVEETTMGDKFFIDYKARQHFQFWPQELPRLTRFLGFCGLKWLIIPSWVNTANFDIESWIMSMCVKAEMTVQAQEKGEQKSKAEDWPTVYAQLRQAIVTEETQSAPSMKDGVDLEQRKKIAEDQRRTIASEMLDHTLAGFDTSSITLTFLAWELSKAENAIWQRRLRREIRQLGRGRDAREIDALPTLHAILTETLRLHAAIPGNQPRITPANAMLGPPGADFGPLPAGVRVQAQAWSLHREPSVFPRPDTWDPARWLDAPPDRHKEMLRWFWAFGSGGRMCVGSNLAVLDMKAIVVAIWGEFRSELVDGEGMVHAGTYVAEPVGRDGKYCLLKLEKASEEDVE